MHKRIYKIRPHHGMCISFFRGKGYSEEFTDHMAKLVDAFSADPAVQIVTSADEICEKCPYNDCGTCATEDKVTRYDNEVFNICGIKAGEVMLFSEFSSLVREKIILCGKREEICGDCEWSEICK